MTMLFERERRKRIERNRKTIKFWRGFIFD